MAKIQILVGSVTGTAEALADHLADRLGEAGHHAWVNDNPSLVDLTRDPEEVLLICTSNTGAGDLPEDLHRLYLDLLSQYPAIAGRRYGIINLGDRGYPTFAEAGQTMDAVLADLGAERLGEPFVHDASTGESPEPLADDWLQDWVNRL